MQHMVNVVYGFQCSSSPEKKDRERTFILVGNFPKCRFFFVFFVFSVNKNYTLVTFSFNFYLFFTMERRTVLYNTLF